MWRNQMSKQYAKAPAARHVRPTLEQLEDRVVPSVDITYGGGPTIPHVEVTNIVMGTPVVPDTTPMMQAIVKDYLPLLGPNYGIGSGTFQGSVSVPAFSANPTDAQVQNFISSEIQSGAVPRPSSSQLYVVFLSTGQTVTDADVSDAWGYHSAFHVNNVIGGLPIYYAVVYGINAGPGDTSIIASHEVAEAVTDPDTMTGWFDRNRDGGLTGEVADIYDGILPFAMDGYWFNVLSGPQGQQIPPQSPPPPLPPLPPPAPLGGGGVGGTGGGGVGSPTFFQAAITLFVDGAEKVLHGDSPALEQSIQANVPYAVFAGIDLGEYLVLTGELAAYNALYGNNGGNS